MSMGPGSSLSPSDQRTVKVLLGIDETAMSKVLKANSQEEDVEFLGNLGG